MRWSRSKLKKHEAMARSSKLAAHLPDTRRRTRENFYALLETYGAVIVKPVGGWGGKGVISVVSKGGNEYVYQKGKKKIVIRGRDAVYERVREKTKGAKTLVQRKISLATVDGKPFDLRVMVQRKKDSPWRVTGKLAKVAGSGYIVTNIRRSGGKVLPFDEAVRRSKIRHVSLRKLERRVDDVALTAAKQLGRSYRIDVCGLDIGLDARGKVWIIEPNFTPDPGLFKKLKDRSMYRRILSYGK